MNITRPDQLANCIKAYRKQAGLSQKQVAELIGIRVATLSDFENKPESSKLETFFKILAALELQLDVSSRKAAKADSHANDIYW